MQYFNSDTAAGTAGGTLLGIILHINGEDVIKTMVLAAIGAVISFGVSVSLKWGLDKIRAMRQRK